MTGIKLDAEILLPKDQYAGHWPVIACDQYTQDSAYWEAASQSVENNPSSLNIILPEIYLNDNRLSRIEKIHKTMEHYLADAIFQPPVKGCIYVERSTAWHPRRRGLVLAIDLEQYEYGAGKEAGLIRPTEATVPERLPVRMEVRRGASLESPHVLVLINDKSDGLFKMLETMAQAQAKPVYDVELMAKSGHIKGYAITNSQELAQIEAYFNKLQAQSSFVFAVGDGNHSLASAKALYEEAKSVRAGSASLGSASLLRYALVEIENIYDEGISFEPIHRVLFGVKEKDAIDYIEKAHAEARRRGGGGSRLWDIHWDGLGLVTPLLQPVLDALVETTPGASMDYIHGTEEVERIVRERDDAIGLILPPINKDGFFETIEKSGVLPRKSFSMGEADEKRFYYECRRLYP
ncbi:MAG: DUF1015 domain-containing protein [Spirochaetaceae bacterium]|jgi:uncharacterized protein (DUF1015 family)|nr:DUF1015 domain-containing protein [Spirochaetaceae bacterium]